ncbi:MAG: hypothetical protein AB8G77_19240 [Rhodothermales bacterium]
MWPVDTQVLVKRACEMIARNFTQAEWDQYFPGEDYKPVCPGRPIPADVLDYE